VALPADITSLISINGSSAVAVGLGSGHVATWQGDGVAAVLLKPHAARVLAVASTADGSQLWSVADDGSVALSAVAAATSATSPKVDFGPGGARVAMFSGDGSVLVSGGAFGDVRVFDTASGALRHQLLGHRTEVQALAIRPGSSLVASASAEADLRVWDAAAGKQVGFVDGDLSLFSLGFSPRDGTLATGGVDRRLTFRDADAFAPVGELPLAAPKMVVSLVWSSDGRFLAVGDIDDTTLSKGGISIVDAASRAVVANLDTSGRPMSLLTFVPDGRVIGAVGRELRTWTVDAVK
jgi:WD40 repeat protein